jgi:tRNA(fMet)-specific endonuclease VapC
MFILDTDHFSLHIRAHAEISRRILELNPTDVSISVVTIEEALGGWFTALRQAKGIPFEIQAYASFFQTVQAIKKLKVVPFSPDSVLRFHELRKQHRRLGRMDLAIAAIALEFGATLVTRNRVDFEQIPGLQIEDWSEPSGGEQPS